MNARVLAIDLDASTRIEALQLEPERRERVRTANCDITDGHALAETLAEIERIWETPTGLVNNAGLDSPPDAPAEETGPYETYPRQSWDDVLKVNTTGMHLCCQVFGAAMARIGGGSIVNIASIYGMVSPDQDLYEYRRERGETFYKPVAYSVSKSAVYGLTRYLAAYWGHRQVRVNAVTPAGVFNDQDPEFLEAYLRKVPLGRMADETDCNGAIVFLLSDAARYITGSNLVVDGGFTSL